MASSAILTAARNGQITGGLLNSRTSHREDTDQPYGKEKHKTEKIKKKKWNVWPRNEDEVRKFGKPDDLIIPVMGAAGTGKSTFINTLLGKEEAKVGHTFDTGTRILQQFSLSIPDKFRELQHRRLVVVDTPGFDDMYISDQEILRRISAWLAYAYANNMKIAGIIYLYDISQPRLHSSTMQNTEMFRRLCGEDALSGVVLVTTKWNLLLRGQDGIAREKLYRKGLWKDLILAGSAVKRFDGTQDSASKIVDQILRKFQNTHNVDALQIQTELVDPVNHSAEVKRGIEDQINQVKSLNTAISRRILIFFGLSVL